MVIIIAFIISFQVGHFQGILNCLYIWRLPLIFKKQINIPGGRGGEGGL